MKKILIIASLFVVFASIQSCKKDADATPSNGSDSSCTSSPYRIGTVATFSNSSSGYTINITGTYSFNGKNYLKGTTTMNSNSSTGYIYVDPTNGDDWQMIPATGDLPTNEMIYCKPSQPVGTTWSYTYASISAPTIVSYKYTYSISKKGVSFTLGNTTNTNCTQVHCLVETYYSGAVVTSATTDYTFACGWGLVQTLQNGNVYSTLTNLTY